MAKLEQKIDFKEYMLFLLRKGYTLKYLGKNNFCEWYSLSYFNHYSTIDIALFYSGDIKIDKNDCTVTRESERYINNIVNFLKKIDDKKFLHNELSYYNEKFSKITDILFDSEILYHTYE